MAEIQLSPGLPDVAFSSQDGVSLLSPGLPDASVACSSLDGVGGSLCSQMVLLHEGTYFQV